MEQNMVLKLMRVREGAIIPKQATAGSAGYDLCGIKKGIHVTNGVGVIDSDYRGEIQIGLHNLSAEPYTVQPGERIAQMIIMPYFAPVIEEVTSLTETDRGAGGFGITGTK